MAPIQSISGDALVVCACGGKEYKARDVIDAALFRGELEKSWKEFLCRIAAEQRARELKLELDYVASIRLRIVLGEKGAGAES